MKRRGMVSVGLVLLEVLLLLNLGRWLAGQDPEVRLVLGLHLMGLVVVFVAVYLIRTKTDPAQVWPEDLDDVWPDEGPEPVRECDPAANVHRAISPDSGACYCGAVTMARPEAPTEVLEPVPDSKPCGSRRFHKAHEWITTDEAGTEPEWCPGYAGRKKAAASG